MATAIMGEWQTGSYPETGFEEISGDVLEADFSGLRKRFLL
jgi:hypothetical protein